MDQRVESTIKFNEKQLERIDMARMLKSNDLEIYETGINFMRQI